MYWNDPVRRKRNLWRRRENGLRIFFLVIVKFHKMSQMSHQMSHLPRWHFQWWKWIIDHGIFQLGPFMLLSSTNLLADHPRLQSKHESQGFFSRFTSVGSVRSSWPPALFLFSLVSILHCVRTLAAFIELPHFFGSTPMCPSCSFSGSATTCAHTHRHTTVIKSRFEKTFLWETYSMRGCKLSSWWYSGYTCECACAFVPVVHAYTVSTIGCFQTLQDVSNFWTWPCLTSLTATKTIDMDTV